MLEIRDVHSASDLKRFVAFPERLYAQHPCYVPKLVGEELNTLRRDRNPAFEYCDARCWMAFRDGEPVGRIAGIVNRRDAETWRRRRARFGWIDFVDDADVSSALVGTVETWARAQGLEAVHGPMGFCDMDREGLLVDGFDELDMLVTIYNHPYYPAHLERLGYRPEADWLEYEMPVPAELPAGIERVARAALERSRLRVVDTHGRRDLLPYVDGVFALINQAYKDLYSVVLLSDRQVRAYTKAFFGFINHEYAKVIVDRDDRVAGFGIGMPSLSRALQKCRGRLAPFGFLHLLRAIRSNDRLDLLLTAVRPDLQNKGLTAVLIHEFWKACRRNGIRYAVAAPELETNEKVQALWTRFESRQHRRRRCYVKAL